MVSFELKKTSIEEMSRTGVMHVSYKDMLKTILNKAPASGTFSVEEMARRYPVMKALIGAEPGDTITLENKDFEVVVELVPLYEWPVFHPEMYELVLDVREAFARKSED